MGAKIVLGIPIVLFVFGLYYSIHWFGNGGGDRNTARLEVRFGKIGQIIAGLINSAYIGFMAALIVSGLGATIDGMYSISPINFSKYCNRGSPEIHLPNGKVACGSVYYNDEKDHLVLLRKDHPVKYYLPSIGTYNKDGKTFTKGYGLYGVGGMVQAKNLFLEKFSNWFWWTFIIFFIMSLIKPYSNDENEEIVKDYRKMKSGE